MNRYNKKTKFRAIIKWLLISVVIIIANTISITGGATRAKPLLLIPIVICISAGENELVSGIVGSFCGLLLDMSSGKLIGGNAFFLLITGVVTSLIFLHLMRKNLINVTIIIILASVINGLLDLFFYFAMWNYENYSTVFIKRTVPSAVLTIIFSPIIYFIIKYITSKFAEPEIMVLEEKPNKDERNKF